jgi:hypothetical protein
MLFFDKMRTFTRFKYLELTREVKPALPISQFFSFKNSRNLKAEEEASWATCSSPEIELLKSRRFR